MKQIFKKIFLAIIILSFFVISKDIYAAGLRDKLDNLDGNNTHIQTIARDGGMATTKSLPSLLSSIIKLVLGLFGVIALLFVIKAGVTWMGSKGDSGKIREARKIIAAGIIGLAIISTSYASTDFLLDQIILTTNKGYEAPGNPADYTNPDGTITQCTPKCATNVDYEDVYNGNSCDVASKSTTSGVLSTAYDARCKRDPNNLFEDRAGKTWDCLCNGGISVSCYACKFGKE